MSRPFTVEQVISILPLEFNRQNGDEISFTCPYCGAKRHMNVNVETGYFHCLKCDAHGGIVKLFGDSNRNLSYKEAYKEICEKLGITKATGFEYQRKEKRNSFRYNQNVSKTKIIADNRVLNNTYSQLLEILPLYDRDREFLLKRGFSENQIEKYGFRSTPKFIASDIGDMLIERGCDLGGVPGFFKNPLNQNRWELNISISGILIPMFSFSGKILAFQIRANNSCALRYSWLSSCNLDCGTSAKSRLCFAKGEKKNQRLFITEGPIKAELASSITGESFIAVPGVNNQISLMSVLKMLREKTGIQEVIMCFDMDRKTNIHVKKAHEKLRATLIENDFKTFETEWDNNFKGIDDYLVAYPTTEVDDLIVAN